MGLTMVIIETSIFTRQVRALLSDEEFRLKTLKKIVEKEYP